MKAGRLRRWGCFDFADGRSGKISMVGSVYGPKLLFSGAIQNPPLIFFWCLRAARAPTSITSEGR